MDKEENIVRKILKNEITWVFFLLTGGWVIVSTIILPINTIQTQLAQIQTNISDSKTNVIQLQTEYNDLDNRVSVLEQEVKNLLPMSIKNN